MFGLGDWCRFSLHGALTLLATMSGKFTLISSSELINYDQQQIRHSFFMACLLLHHRLNNFGLIAL